MLDGSVSGLLGWLVVGLGGVVTGFVLGCRFGVLVFVGVGLGFGYFCYLFLVGFLLAAMW